MRWRAALVPLAAGLVVFCGAAALERLAGSVEPWLGHTYADVAVHLLRGVQVVVPLALIVLSALGLTGVSSWIQLKLIAAWFRGSDPVRAAEALRGLGELEAAGDLELRAGRPLRAADDWLAAKRPVLAARALERAFEHERASQAWEAAGARERAARSALEAHAFDRAGRLYEEAGLVEESADAYRRGRNPEAAAGVLERWGHPDRAAHELEEALQHNHPAIGATAARRREVTRKISALYLKKGDKHAAALACAKAGDVDRAIALWTEIGDAATAGRLARKTGRFQVAVELLERARLPREAAAARADDHIANDRPLYAALERQKAGDLEGAARAFDEAGALAEAARCWDELGEYAAATDCRARAAQAEAS
jgi:hypothetical protein